MVSVHRVHREVEGGYAAPALWDNQREAPHTLSPTMRALHAGERMIYAMRLPDGVIKIGCCSNLANRRSQLHGQILGFRPGDFDDERVIHADLKPHRARGREYYHATTEVMAVANELRDEFGLPHIAA